GWHLTLDHGLGVGVDDRSVNWGAKGRAREKRSFAHVGRLCKVFRPGTNNSFQDIAIDPERLQPPEDQK
ncbi:hypothetical protein GW17_00040189, partial [Ensete ventricosum]